MAGAFPCGAHQIKKRILFAVHANFDEFQIVAGSFSLNPKLVARGAPKRCHTFLECRFSERKVVKTDRVEKILVSAMKQSLKPTLPVLNGMTPFKKFVAQPFTGQKFIAHCYEGDKEPLMQALAPGEDALVLIGPEGDFTSDELSALLEIAIPVSFGPTILRAETAAIFGLSVLAAATRK